MVTMGITGGIGSGKSYVSALLRQMGIPVYDCDAAAKRLNNESSLIRQGLTDLVGEEVYAEEGLVKSRLAQYLFSSPDHARQVNAIVHPVVLSDFRQWLSCQDSWLVGMESAILYESGFHREVDHVLFVDAPLELRIFRTMRRDHADRQQVEMRIAHQRSDEMRSKADWLIVNDGVGDEQLTARLKQIVQSLQPAEHL